MVEALVAIAVLTIGVIGPLTLLAGAIANANYAKNQITAFFLAQEAQELVINQRDQNILQGKNSGDTTSDNYWLSGHGLRKCVAGGTDGVCYVDAYKQVKSIPDSTDDNFLACNEGGVPGQCPVLKLDNQGFYGYGEGIPTIFKRQIEVIPIPPTSPYLSADEREAVVKVTITWNEKSLSRTFTLNSIIYRY